MLKTSIYNKFYSRIRSYNDQLWYSMFTGEELNIKLSRFSDNAKKLYTKDAFVDNQYSPKIMVKLQNLQRHQEESQKLLWCSTLSICYEIISNYMGDVFDIFKTYNNLNRYNWDKGVGPEENLFLLFQRNGVSGPRQIYFKTLGYIRHRRNHFIHMSDTPNPAFATFINESGISLNTKWRNPCTVKILDFTSVLNVSEFQLQECIEMINILGICMNEIDRCIAPLLDKEQVIKALVDKEFGSEASRMNNDIAHKRSERLIAVAKMELGLAITAAECDPHVRRVGIR